MVHDLILPISKTWNQSRISTLFYPFEAQQIQSIPIIDTNCPDEFCWPKTKEGVYTVKSSYQAIQDWKNKDNDPAPSDVMKENKTWKILWKQKIPPKYTHLMWRLFHNGLPVRSNLGSRGISCNPLCPRCEGKIEDINHVFKGCEWAKQIWFASPLNIRFENLTSTNFKDWLINTLPTTPKEGLELISTLCATIYGKLEIY
jgi:hypothetical protein